ncbi:MaoC family dehydratase [Phreatobacter sp.]|uniref:MaoC family dehydratase n=1 Tax=Phreatobacter sp. TaxID=1966341 RepID=UPI003F71D740
MSGRGEAAGLPPVGTAFTELRFGPLDAAMVSAYAAASGDDNPIHTDPAAARAVGLDGPVVQGMMSMALAGRALAHWLPAARCLKLSCRFVLPVLVGATLTIGARVVQREDAARRAILRIVIKGEDGRMAAMAEAAVAA